MVNIDSCFPMILTPSPTPWADLGFQSRGHKLEMLNFSQASKKRAINFACSKIWFEPGKETIYTLALLPDHLSLLFNFSRQVIYASSTRIACAFNLGSYVGKQNKIPKFWLAGPHIGLPALPRNTHSRLNIIYYLWPLRLWSSWFVFWCVWLIGLHGKKLDSIEVLYVAKNFMENKNLGWLNLVVPWNHGNYTIKHHWKWKKHEILSISTENKCYPTHP